eukprot:TRINITY_DN24969_c0_g1_i1.p1 TRINITY_DN24969_c0_g1~~TRINITY_DN24969_c0_g1_i1.p1  ORF type:complete len:192 (+),score=62.11 TRINITY_DN24969_c0_g1_i1:115-690(+)
MCFFFFQAEDGIRDLVRSRGLGDVYKRQALYKVTINVKAAAFQLDGVARQADHAFDEIIVVAVRQCEHSDIAAFRRVIKQAALGNKAWVKIKGEPIVTVGKFGDKNTVSHLKCRFHAAAWYMEAAPAEGGEHQIKKNDNPCLLYTSDAADDLLCVDLGGRRIIKKKKIVHKRLNVSQTSRKMTVYNEHDII